MSPRLVLVGGTHGAGKTTLATRLSSTLAWPLVSRDHIRSGLGWSAGEEVPEPGGARAKQAVTVFFATIAELLEAGVPVIADSPFRRGISENDLRPILTRAGAPDARLIHCSVPRELAVDRCRARPGGDVVAAALDTRDEERWRRVEQPLDLDVPVLHVDMTDGYAPGFDAIVAFATDRD